MAQQIAHHKGAFITCMLMLSLVVGLMAALSPMFTLMLLGVCAVGAMLAASLLLLQPWHYFKLYLYLLPPHVLLMSLLLVAVGLPAGIVKGVSAWKEITLLGLLVIMLFQLIQKPSVVITFPDLAALLFGAYVSVFALVAFAWQTPVSVLLYSLRDMLLPILVYFVGRSQTFSEARAKDVYQMVVHVALVVSALGIAEWLLVPTRWHVLLGIPRYFQELLGITYPSYLLGLPENYWTSGNSGSIRRAVSVFGSSQAFALSYLLFFPICMYGAFSNSLSRQRIARAALLLSFVALCLSFTRYTIAVCVVLAVLAAMLTNRRARRAVIFSAVVIGCLLIVFLFVSSRFRLLVVNTITFEDHSSSSRLAVWATTLEMIAEQPYGYGLGMVGQTAARFQRMMTPIEGQYSKIGVELGIPGLLAYIGVLVSISMYTLRTAYRATLPYQKGLCFGLGLTCIGLAINSVTTEWHNNPALVYPAFWLAGACVGISTERAHAAPES